MSPAAITRRSLLLAGAGTLAGAALRPAGALAALAASAEPKVGEVGLGTVGPSGRTVRLARGVRLVGLQWRLPAGARPQARVRLPDGGWGPWASAATGGHGPEGGAGGAGVAIGEPLWTGGAVELQVRCTPPLQGARLRTVGAPGESAPGRWGDRSRARQSASLPLAQPVLAAGPGQPPVIAREAWARGRALPRVAPEYGAVELGFVHHTENPNGYAPGDVPAMLAAIYAFHRFVNGWNDIGYNFVVDLFGRIWEARAGGIDEPVVGAHAGGYNLYSTGVAVLGSFSGQPVPPAARRALQRLLAWKLSLHGTPARGRVTVRVNPAGASYSKYPARARVSLPRIAGHRDADSTECPGNDLYGQLPRVRGAVAAIAGVPVRITLTELRPPAPVPVPGEAAPPNAAPAPAPQLQAVLKLADGRPLAGAGVLLQARTVSRRGRTVLHSALAQGVTDAQGLLTLPESFAAGAAKPIWVRALYEGGGGYGAAVSKAVQVAPLPAALTPPAASAPSS